MRSIMLFNSWQYAVFLPVVLALYWALPQKRRWVLLLVASYIFYMSWSAKLMALILTTTATSYAAALLISRAKTQSRKKLWLTLGVGISLAMLFVFKYLNFAVGLCASVLSFLHIPAFVPSLNLLLPVGISFYTFQTLSYVIDVYRGALPAEKHFGIYALYVSFFPQLVAGPIERAVNLLPQFHVEHKPNADEWAHGLRLIAWGLFKKVAIADFIGVYVDAAYNDINACGPMAYVVATALFAVQIYCDFSGYSDVAIGSAKLLGFKLMENFNAPYFARSIKEFWRRWHISLSTWFSDYVYIPLGGSRVSVSRHLANLVITFLLSGLWHGAKLTFVLWGLCHGLLLCLDVFLLPKREKWLKNAPRLKAFIETAVTLVLVVLLWIPFRANSLSDALTIFARLPYALSAPVQGFTVALETLGITSAVLIRIILSFAALAAYDAVRRYKGQPFEILARQKSPVRFAVSYALAFCVTLAIFTQPAGTVAEFIYFQF